MTSLLDSLDPTARLGLEAMSEAHDAKQWAKCVEVGDAWLDARGSMPAIALVWYSQSLMAERRLDEALMWSGFAVDALKGLNNEAAVAAYSNYGQALARAGRWSEARKALKAMTKIPLAPGEGQEKQGHVLLAISDKWRQGWAMTEGRLLTEGRGFPEQCVAWDGVTKEPVAVLHEQGLGDAVLFARWLPQFADYTGHPVTWYGPPLLHDWLSAIPNVRVLPPSALEGQRDVVSCYAMSLPHLMRCERPSDIPEPVAPRDLREQRRFHRPRRGHLKVGVCWQGSAGGWHDFERSFPLSEFAPVWAPLDGVEFVNLTHAASVDDSCPFHATQFASVHHTGEVIAALDLVVSVDTSIVHIAGSLGVPTLAIVPTVPDWRYQWPHGGSTPFYPSVTVLRKQHLLDVGPVAKARTLLERYAHALNQRVA